MSWPVLVATAGTAGAVALLLDRLAVRLLRPPPREPERTPDDLPSARPGGHREVRFPAPGGAAIRGWRIEPREEGPGRAVVVLAHGWGATSGRMLGLAGALLEAGHPVVAFDFRGHGRSEGGGVATVRHFRDDVAAACRSLREEEPGRPVVVVGHSMGGAAAILAAADGAPVDGVVVVAAPVDVLDATATYLRSRGLPGRPLVTLLLPFWKVRIREPLHRLVPGRRARELGDRPVLVIHGSDDERVPPEDGEALARASGGRLLAVPGVDHVEVLERAEVAEAVASFVREEIDAGPAAAGRGERPAGAGERAERRG